MTSNIHLDTNVEESKDVAELRRQLLFLKIKHSPSNTLMKSVVQTITKDAKINNREAAAVAQ